MNDQQTQKKSKRKWLIPLLLLGSVALVAAVVIPIVLTKCKPGNTPPPPPEDKVYSLDGKGWGGWESGTLVCKPNPDNETVTITDGTGYHAKNLVIPSKVYSADGKTIYTVTALGDSAFSEKEDCNLSGSLTIADSVTDIGEFCFYAGTGLKDSGLKFDGNLTIGNGVKNIGYSAFSHMGFIGTLKIPDNVETIGRSAFSSDDKFEKLVIGKGVTTIDENTFAHCNFGGTVEIPNNVEIICDGAFSLRQYPSRRISNITISKPANDSDIVIQGTPFYEWNNVQSITVYWTEGNKPDLPENWNWQAEIIYS